MTELIRQESSNIDDSIKDNTINNSNYETGELKVTVESNRKISDDKISTDNTNQDNDSFNLDEFSEKKNNNKKYPSYNINLIEGNKKENNKKEKIVNMSNVVNYPNNKNEKNTKNQENQENKNKDFSEVNQFSNDFKSKYTGQCYFFLYRNSIPLIVIGPHCKCSF